ncbi:MAG: 16S rRNA (cytosine(967)-C(5))-methyltransferase RsmB [Erysipelotrichaceae bacterium]|nr:16S rRNA (cytosine(967)-C(5))-methyltransferase RsmB [Erysipelotrichaceae bacterium]
MANVRKKAFEILKDVMLHNEYASLNMRYGGYDLNEKDQGLLTQIVYGTIRNYRYVRYQWELYVDRKVPDEIAVLLDGATYQLILLDKLPAYAVVNETVAIAKDEYPNYAGFVNAVLRRIADKGAQAIKGDDEVDKFAIETSHPTWLVRMWNAQYGEEICDSICWENLKDGRVELAVNTLLTTADKLLEDERFHRTAEGNALIYDGNIFASEYFKNNLVYVQSESSQQAVEILDPKPKERILDMCRAPGTKTVQIAMKTGNDANIYSIDVYPQRVELIENALKKYGITCVTTMCEDSRTLHTKIPLYYYDKVLLDAPCSGLGTLKHKPEIKMSIKPEDIDEIVRLQSQLLDSAALMVKAGGCLVYSTCTLNTKENEKQIRMFLSQHTQFELVEEKTIIPDGTHYDGFYISKLRKTC